MLNIAPYIAKYVRSLHAKYEHLEIPYSHSQFGVALMVDIVGFSSLSTKASEKGDSGAEAIAVEIGSYMGECIEIIEHFGGDVVKFLGDAVLVCFQDTDFDNTNINLHQSIDQKNRLVERAVECGLELLAKQSHYRVYLTTEERTKYRTLSEDTSRNKNQPTEPHKIVVFDGCDDDSRNNTAPIEEYSTSFNFWKFIPLLFGQKTTYQTRQPSDTSDTTESNGINLELHIALSCGIITNIVLGDINTTSQNLDQISLKKNPIPIDSINKLKYHGRLEYAICGPAVEALENILSVAKAGEMSITPEAYALLQSVPLQFEKRNACYIIKSPPPKKSLHKRPLEPRPRVSRIISPERPLSSPNYLRYINESALYRLQHSPDDNFPAQFRDATIMFISLGDLNPATPDGMRLAQRAVSTTMRVLVKYEGILQQFAVDDKGATILAVFGLPPLSHEREAIFAAKAALELREAYGRFLDRDFAIALATGTIFNSVLPHGNPIRRDPAIAGEAIILAVRLLKFEFSKCNVVCDMATKQQIGRTCEFEDYGERFVKGKLKPVAIYGIMGFAHKSTKRISHETHSSDFIGYRTEMAQAADFLNDWSEAPNHHLMVIAGPSGVGKSFFCHALSKRLGNDGTVSCWSQSAEVEKSSNYYLAKNALLTLFEIIDTERVPVRKKSHVAGSEISIGDESPISAIFPTSPTTILSKIHSPVDSPHYTSSVQPINSASGLGLTDHTNEMIELISRCLWICGEEQELLPLFKAIFAALADLPDTRYTLRLDSRGRDILLTGLIGRMIKYVSDHVNLVFILDDIQWADSASIRLLQHVHEHCLKVLIVVATRPLKDYKMTFMNDFRDFGSYEEIDLNGLGVTEIGEIILQTFQTVGVTSVSSEIVHVIQKRTGGNPLYVKNMALVLKDFNHVTVVENVLVPSNNQFDLEDLLGNFDYKRIIKMQFDRLEGSFQEFLTVASCLDQYFTIAEVKAVIKVNNTEFNKGSDEDIQKRIDTYDVYHFLQKADEKIMDTNGDVYTFAHITIPQSIYDMVSYETRIKLHRLLASYYESQMTRENHRDLLCKVNRHYLQTDLLDKQLLYLEHMADLNMKSFLLSEATVNLEKIVKILDENQELAQSFGRIYQSEIYRRLGMCFTMRTKLKEGEQFLFHALECLGEPWPQSEPEFLYKFWKNRMAQYRYRKLWVFRQKESEQQRMIRIRVIEIMVQLSNIYFYTGKGRMFVYACLVGLNECERLNEIGPHYTLFLARVSLLSWLNDKKEESIFYITRALRYMDEKDDADTLTICAHLCFAAGKFKNARELLYQSIAAVKTLGVITDCQAFYRSVGLVITMRIFEGTLDNSPDDLALLKEMANTAHSNCDFEAEIWLCVYNVGNALIMDRLRECGPFITLLEVHLKQSADYNKIAIYGTLLCYYAKTKNYEAARRHTRALVSILPLLTVTPNIFPIFGLIFATMGMYWMIEDEQVDLVSTGDSKNYDSFILGVSRINHAFQQVKFWEFTQPCLYLARALPYISTGRTVEGFMVLQHGVMEMRFIQEIRFLKAYYWANLGKYAFTPADRIEWTNRAKADFDDLRIPSHDYCNPNPENSYSRDKPADIIST